MRLLVPFLALVVMLLVSCRHGSAQYDGEHGDDDHHHGPHGSHHGHQGICKLKFVNTTVACQEDCPADYTCDRLTIELGEKARHRMSDANLDTNTVYTCKSLSTPTACSVDTDCASGEKCIGRWNNTKSCYPVKDPSTMDPCGDVQHGQQCTLTCAAGAGSCLTGLCVERRHGMSKACLPQCKAFLALSHRRYREGHAHGDDHGHDHGHGQ